MLGVTEEDRQLWRDQVLSTTAADFVAFADRIDAVAQSGSVAVVGSEKAIAEIRAGALEAIEEVAKDTAAELVTAMGGKADAATIDSAVSARVKG